MTLSQTVIQNVSWEHCVDVCAQRAYVSLLESTDISSSLSVFSILACSPMLVLNIEDNRTCVTYRDGKKESFDVPYFDVLDRFVRRFQHHEKSDYPLGAAIGFVNYESARFLSDFDYLQEPADCSEICFAFYDQLFIRDVKTLEIKHVFLDIMPDSLAMKETLLSAFKLPERTPDSYSVTDLAPLISKKDYLEQVSVVLDYIRRGDIYQVNYSYPYKATLTGSKLALYRRLNEASPAPFSAYLEFGDTAIFSSSPERFILISGRDIETRPIKGTSKRVKDDVLDAQYKEDLLRSEKDAAELLMIVDLERNDLNKICTRDSVRVPELKVLESYAQVHHLVSRITGSLRDDISHVDAFKSLFPGGSITGAPKIRAMEIIKELERSHRRIYTGCIGYFGFNNKSDFNIAIRTIYAHNEALFFHVGSGIVSDSIPENEYEETQDKARGMLEALTKEKK